MCRDVTVFSEFGGKYGKFCALLVVVLIEYCYLAEGVTVLMRNLIMLHYRNGIQWKGIVCAREKSVTVCGRL